MKSISFPVIGTCGLGFPKNKASHIMISEVFKTVKEWDGKSCVKDIRFVVFDKDQLLVEAFQKEFSTLLKRAKAHSSSAANKDGKCSRSEESESLALSSSTKAVSVKIFGENSQLLSKAEEFLKKAVSDRCNTEVLETNLSAYQRSHLLNEVRRLEVEISYVNKTHRLEISGVSERVAVLEEFLKENCK